MDYQFIHFGGAIQQSREIKTAGASAQIRPRNKTVDR